MTTPKDSPQKAEACFELLKRVQRGEEEVRTSEAIVSEVVYAAHYGLHREQIRALLKPILNLRGLRLARKRTFLKALDIYATYQPLDFEDALSVAYMEEEGIAELYSYDKGFDRVTSVRRIEP